MCKTFKKYKIYIIVMHCYIIIQSYWSGPAKKKPFLTMIFTSWQHVSCVKSDFAVLLPKSLQFGFLVSILQFRMTKLSLLKVDRSDSEYITQQIQPCGSEYITQHADSALWQLSLIWIEKPIEHARLLDITHGNNCVWDHLLSNWWH